MRFQRLFDSIHEASNARRLARSEERLARVTGREGIAPATTRGGSIRETFYQAAHGLTAGKCVYHNGTNWVAADATAPSTKWSLGVIERVSTNRLTVVFFGSIALSGLTGGTTYFLHPTTAGAYTATLSDNVYAQAVLYALSATDAIVLHAPIHKLASAIDVAITSGAIATSKYLSWDTGSSKWINTTALPPNTAVAPGTYGSTTQSPVITIGADGRITSASNATIAGGGGVSALDDLTDVTITAAASGDYLRHNGTDWVDYSLGSLSYDSATNTLGLGTVAAPMKVGIPNAGRLIVDNTALLEWVLSGNPDLDTEITAKARVESGNVVFRDQGDYTGGTSGTEVLRWTCSATAGSRLFDFKVPIKISGTEGLYLDRTIASDDAQLRWFGGEQLEMLINGVQAFYLDNSASRMVLAYKLVVKGAIFDVSGGAVTLSTNFSPTGNVNAGGYVNSVSAYRANGTLGLTQTVTLAKLTAGGTNGSMTFAGGILTAYTAPT